MNHCCVVAAPHEAHTHHWLICLFWCACVLPMLQRTILFVYNLCVRGSYVENAWALKIYWYPCPWWVSAMLVCALNVRVTRHGVHQREIYQHGMVTSCTITNTNDQCPGGCFATAGHRYLFFGCDERLVSHLCTSLIYWLPNTFLT